MSTHVLDAPVHEVAAADKCDWSVRVNLGPVPAIGPDKCDWVVRAATPNAVFRPISSDKCDWVVSTLNAAQKPVISADKCDWVVKS